MQLCITFHKGKTCVIHNTYKAKTQRWVTVFSVPRGENKPPPELVVVVKFRLIECNYFAKGTYSTPLGPFTGAARSACAA